MSKKYQRKVNQKLRLFNQGFAKDIAPYNHFYVKQFKRVGDREHYDAMWLIHLYYDNVLVYSKWVDYHDISGARLFWWINNSIAEMVSKGNNFTFL